MTHNTKGNYPHAHTSAVAGRRRIVDEVEAPKRHLGHVEPRAVGRINVCLSSTDKETAALLRAILATEISPELVPAGADGKVQSTESFVGPYALQDFNLFYLTR